MADAHRCVNDLPDAKSLTEGESMECPGCTRRLSVVEGKWKRHEAAPLDDTEVPEFGEWLHRRIVEGAKPDAPTLLAEYLTAVQVEVQALAKHRGHHRSTARQIAAEERQYAAHVAAMEKGRGKGPSA